MFSLRAPYYQVSSFTSATGRGNPAGVVLLPPSFPPPSETSVSPCLQRAAQEVGLSETAFLSPSVPGTDFTTGHEFTLRWFSPKKEVSLCGHGTLAAAHALLAFGNPSTSFTFHTLSGALTVAVNACSLPTDAQQPLVSDTTLAFPSNPPVARAVADPVVAAIALALLGPQHAALVQACAYSAAAKKAILLLPPGSQALLAALQPQDPQSLLRIEQPNAAARIEGVSLACADTALSCIFTRYWSPWNLGMIGEDPVNGSSHTLLAPYFASLLHNISEGQEMLSTQLSPRGGQLHVAVLPGARVSLRGQATTVCEGALYLHLAQ